MTPTRSWKWNPRTLLYRCVPGTFRGRLALAISAVFLVSMGLATTVQTIMVNGVVSSAVSAAVSQQAASEPEPAMPTEPPDAVEDSDRPEAYAYAGKGSMNAGGTASAGSPGSYQVEWGSGGMMTLRTPDGTVIWSQDTITDALRLSAAVIFVLFGAASVAAVWIVTSRMSRQLKSISDQASALDPSDLDARIDAGCGREGERAVEIVQLAAAINGMLDRIQTASEAERRFVSNASHELRTPIAAVETNLDAPLSQGRFPAAVEPSVRRALAANRRGAALVEALLTLSRIQSGAIGGICGTDRTGTGEDTDLATCVRDAMDDARQTAESAGIVLTERGCEEPCRVPVNRSLLDLTVGNLVRNAVAHNTHGGSVDVTLARHGGTATLAMENTTDADLPDDLTELFQPFHRGADSRISAVPGVGLGLSIAAAACDAMGVTLRLSVPAAGRFRAEISLPAQYPCACR